MNNAPAHTESEPDLKGLETLYVVCDRFSHSIRTHLGVALGTIDDLIAGYTLSEPELRDGRNALQTILGALESVREITNRPQFDPVQCNLREFIEHGAESRFGLDGALRLTTAVAPISGIHQIDTKLLWRAIRSLLKYAALAYRKDKRRAQEDLAPAEITLELCSHLGMDQLQIQFPHIGIDGLPSLLELRQLAAIDHAPESLGLLFADEVARLHGIQLLCSVTERSHMTFTARF